MRNLIQRPARWMLDALGIVSGTAPQELDDVVLPVVDIIQGGWGRARTEQIVMATSLAVSVTLDVTAEPNERFAIKLSVNNPGTAAQFCTLRHGIENRVLLNEITYLVAAGSQVPMTTLYPIAPWVSTLPGARLEITVGPSETNVGYVTILLVRLPAGTAIG